MTTDNKKKWSFMQGITTHNPVFASGLAIAPAVFAGSTLSGALTYAAFFSAVTFTALFFSSLLPRRIPYALRIISVSFSHLTLATKRVGEMSGGAGSFKKKNMCRRVVWSGMCIAV